MVECCLPLFWMIQMLSYHIVNSCSQVLAVHAQEQVYTTAYIHYTAHGSTSDVLITTTISHVCVHHVCMHTHTLQVLSGHCLCEHSRSCAGSSEQEDTNTCPRGTDVTEHVTCTAWSQDSYYCH
jgi:hypothetical protein